MLPYNIALLLPYILEIGEIWKGKKKLWEIKSAKLLEYAKYKKGVTGEQEIEFGR